MSEKFKVGDRVECLDAGLAQLRAICPGFGPNHHGTISEVWEDGEYLVNFDDGTGSPWPESMLRPINCDGDVK